jgi:hypothetical protein
LGTGRHQPTLGRFAGGIGAAGSRRGVRLHAGNAPTFEPIENLVEPEPTEPTIASAKQLPQLRENPRQSPFGLPRLHDRVTESLKRHRIAERVPDERHPRRPLSIILRQRRKAIAEPRRRGARIDPPPLQFLGEIGSRTPLDILEPLAPSPAGQALRVLPARSHLLHPLRCNPQERELRVPPPGRPRADRSIGPPLVRAPRCRIPIPGLLGSREPVVDPVGLTAQKPEGARPALRQDGDRRREALRERLHDRLRLPALLGAEHLGHLRSMGVEPIALHRYIKRAVRKALHNRAADLSVASDRDQVGDTLRRGLLAFFPIGRLCVGKYREGQEDDHRPTARRHTTI